MASAQGIRAGRAYVEVSSDDSRLQAGMRRVERRLRAFGATVGDLGRRFAVLGAAAVAPLAAAVRAYGSYEDALASLRSAANPTAEDLDRIRAAIADVSKSTGAGPAEVAAAMTELLKAGMSLEAVLGGAAAAALQFARVAEMEAAEAATVLTDAMNVFGVDARTAVDTLSRAADASSISVRDVAQSFSMAGAVAAQAGLSIDEAANAIAVLGQNGIKGSDAGTSLKTMLLRLQTGAESAGDVMKALGIRVRDASGAMLPMRGIIAAMQARLGRLSAEARDQAMLKLFGTDAIRAGAILLREGTAGWDDFTAKMGEGLPVAAKYEMLMNTLSGAARRAWSALQRLGVAIGEALAPALGRVTGGVVGLVDAVAALVEDNRGLVLTFARGAAATAGLGVALVAVGLAAKALAAGFGLAAAAAGLLLSPVGLIVGGLAAAGVAFVAFSEAGRQALEGLKATATAAFKGIGDALSAGDLGLAARIAWLSIRVEFQEGINAINALWQDWGTAARTVISDVAFTIHRVFNDAWAAVQAGAIHAWGAIRDGWTNLLAFLTKGANALGGLFGKLWATLKSFVTDVDVDAEFARIDAETAAKDAAVDAGTQRTLDARRADRRGALDAIEADRAAQASALDAGQATLNEERFAAARESVAAGDLKLDGLKAELQAALDEAKAKATPAAEDAEEGASAAGGPGKAGAAGGFRLPDLDAAARRASQVLDGADVNRHVQSAIKDPNAKLEALGAEQVEHLGEIARNTRNGGITFAR